MSQENLYMQLIKSLTDSEFDKLVLLYLREVDGISNIINCNGPYDSGLDVRKTDASKIDIQYQITTKETRFSSKLFEDLEKAKNNVEAYGLPRHVKYFYSYPLSNESLFSYKKDAKEKYNLILDIVEAKTIAGITAQFDELRTLLFKIADIQANSGASDFFDDSRVKAFYDLMSFGSSTDIKYNIIKSYVLNYLYKEGASSMGDLLKKINDHFSGKIVEKYFDGFCSRLSTEKKIVKTEERLIDLTEAEKVRIHGVVEKYYIEEALLRKELKEILKRFNLQDLCDSVIIKLSDLYESNYSINLGEFTERTSSINDLKTATQNFNDFIKANIIHPENSENITKQLFEVADKNEILSRIAAGQVYTKVSNPDRLQEYINRQNNNKNIFLDTNIIIHILCVYYEPDADYNKVHYKIAMQLLDFAKKNHLHFKTTRQYTIEVVNIFKEALSIVPFTKLPIFDELGGTKNLLYKFFLHLKDWDLLHDNTSTFEGFLKDFKFETRKSDPDYHFNPQIEYLLNELDIEIETPKKYDINLTRQLIFQDQKENSKHKSLFAINNDSIMLMRLGDNDSSVNPIDPIFCTWDFSLLRVRKKFFEEYPNCTEWLMYTPTRLMDHYSMMNFQVRQGTLSNEVLSILDEDFSFQERTHSLLDSMLTIINPKNEMGLQYINKLAELRQKEIVQIDKKPEAISDDTGDNNSVDIIFRKLFVNYSTQLDENAFASFKTVFTKKEFLNPVFQMFSEEIKFIQTYGTTSSELIRKMDSIILESKTV